MQEYFQKTKNATYYSVKQHHYFSKTNIQQQSLVLSDRHFITDNVNDFSRPTRSVSYTTVTDDPSMTEGRRGK
jgi:hypothetical protein